MQYLDLLTSPKITIKEALQLLGDTAKQILFVVNNERKLLGTVTDGDIRRGLLMNIPLAATIDLVMNRSPKTILKGKSREHIFRYMQAVSVRSLPVLDENGCLVEVISTEDIIYTAKRDNIVVLMAGGLGTRLRPLTNDCPKPLLKIGEKPILETIINGLIDSGFHHFYIAVNYKAEMIEEYFGDGSKWGIEIQYIHENKRMGTAGALYFLPEKPAESIIVMNGDLLTKIDFGALIDSHNSKKASATMAVREYSYQVPYGVINCKGDHIVSIEEKPEQSYFVNAGIYVLSPESVAKVDKEEFYDMPDLFNDVIKDGGKAVIYPVREYWLDIGRLSDFQRAQQEFGGGL